MLPISKDYLQSTCEIKTPENRLLGTGFLENLAEETIQIHQGSESLPTLHCDTFVNIHILNKALPSKSLVGKVFLSAPEMIRIIEVQNLTDFERRNFFRLKLNISTQAYIDQEDMQSEHAVQLFSIRVTDLSLSGCCIETKRKLEIGDRFVAALTLIDSRTSFNCEVRRKPKSEGRYSKYGCVFLNNTNRQSDLLCEYIFEKQREQIKLLRKNADYSE